MGGGIFIVIYVDVLFIVNFFITYLLLLLTSKLSKQEFKQTGLLAASFSGGLYSLIILAESINPVLLALSKIAAAALMTLIAGGFKRVTVYLKNLALFLFSNMLFLGIVSAIQFIFNPKGIELNNATVYFDISAKALLISALIAYFISILVIKLYNRTLSKAEIYSLTIFYNKKEYHFFAFADSGNKLREPFSDYPVIIADKSKIDFDPVRIIPCTTVSGEGMLKAFKPDKVVISNGKKSFETSRVYVALSDVNSKDFSAILNPELLNI